MTNSKSTKRALFTSALAMLMCVAMLIGTTFAWFTDTASTGVNKITSGNLHVEIQDKDGDSIENLEWVAKDGRAQTEILWEPGCTYTLTPFKIVNTGNLALKYKIVITGLDGDSELLDVIRFTYTTEDGEFDMNAEGHLTAKGTDGAATKLITVSAHMDETAGNEYQDKVLENVKFTVYATQDTVEYDSESNEYDAAAEYATPVTTTDELFAAIANGEDVVLSDNVALPAALEVKGDVTIYGNGIHKLNTSATRVINVNDNTEPVTLTLSGVDIDAENIERGISVYGNSNVTIVMDSCSASADHYALNIASDNTNAKVIVRNTTLTGYSAFQTWSSGTNATFENCTLIGNNKWSGSTDDYAAIVIVSDASNSTLTFKNCRIEANELGSADEVLLDARATGAKVTFEGCKFFVNGTEVTGNDIRNNMKTLGDTSLTIK